MGQLTELEPVRKKRKAKKLLRRIILLTIIFTCLMVAAILWKEIKEIDVRTKAEDYYASLGSGPGYPISVPGGLVKNIIPIGDQIGVLDDVGMYTYNGNAKQVQHIQHNYNNPVVKSGGGKTLLYDRGGNRLRVDSKNKNYFNKTYDHTIVYADISEGGNLAVATGSNEYVGQILVYNDKFEEIFKWLSSESHILNIALSPNKEMMAVGCIETVGGEITSSVLIFKFSAKDMVAKLVLPGETILSLEFKENGKIYAVTDKGISKISANGNVETKLDFEGVPIYAFDNNPGTNMAVILGDFKEERALTAYSLDGNLDVRGSKVFYEPIYAIKVDALGLVLTLEEEILCYNPKMEETDKLAERDVKSLQMLDKNIYFATSSEIKKIQANRPGDEKKTLKPSSKASQSSSVGAEKTSSTGEDHSGASLIEESSSLESTPLLPVIEGNENPSANEPEQVG